MTGKAFINENEIAMVMQHFCKVCSPMTTENIFKGVLLNRYPPKTDYMTKNEYIKYFT